MKKRLVLISVTLVLMMPVALLGLIYSASGSSWLLQTIFSNLPAQTSVKTIDGRLLERIVLSDLTYKSDTESVTIQQLIFAWQPAKLLSGTLNIVEISLNGVSINLTETASPAEEGSFDLNAELLLPLDIVIENLLVTDLTFQQGEQRQQLDKLQLSAYTEQGQLTIASLAINAPAATANAKGQIGLGKGFPLNLSADWQFNTENNGIWHAVTTVSGDMRQLFFDNRLSSPFELALKGDLDNLQTAPHINVRGDWQNLNWPLTNQAPQVSSKQGVFELSGLLSDYQITLNGDLTQPTLPKAQLVFTGKGSLEALAIEKLELTSTAGKFLIGGNVGWKDTTVFDLTAAGENFNPAILHPEMPGSLTFSTHLKGTVGETLQLEANINQLSGKLRGYPVSASGKLMLADEQLTVDALKVISGVNKLAVNGTLGQEQAALKFALDAPALQSLWPDLSGSLQADGQLQGTWKNPSVTLQARGKQLRFAEHRAGQVAIDIDYRPDAKKTSHLQFSASAVKTSSTEIATLSIDGLGSPEQHRFKADMRSNVGNLSTVLEGNLKADVWQGAFSKLELNFADFGHWQLLNKSTVRASQTAAGMDITLTELCLVQQAASICSQGSYPANGDFALQVKAAALPASLIQAYLPEQMQLTGLINADAAMQQQKGALTGDVRLTIPANATVKLHTQQGTTELALGAWSLLGQLKGSAFAADFDLALVDKDYLRGHLQLDTGKSQALSGQINASMLNFALLQPFVPQLSAIQGHLNADLGLQGTLEKPVINGLATLKQGAVDMADSDFGLREITLQATANGGRRNRIELQGSARPTTLSNAGTAEQLQLTGLINVTADLQQQAGLLVGQYRLDVPANASITVKNQAAASKIVLGASSLSGNINGTRISADLNLALAAQDYIRAQLQLDTDESQALSGRMTASIVEFSLLNPFVPQLSNLTGNLKADLALGGRLDKPLINGSLQFNQGAVDVPALGIKLHGIKLQALAVADRAERLELNGSATSGQGSITLKGYADLHGAIELILNGTDFEVAKLPEAQIAVSPDLKLLFADKHGKITGKLKIPKAILTLQEIPENAVKVSDDEVILGEEKPKSDAVAVNIDAEIEVELGKQVSFSGQGLETDLSGKLKITKTGDKMVMYGNVDMNKARYKSYGQDLTVRKGRFVFNGPVDKPWLDVEAIRVSKSQAVTAILSLSGPLQSPQTRISSEPALPESEALAYLITGSPLSQVSQSEGDRVASAALSYGGGKVSWLADKLGVDDFEVKEGKTLQDTLVAVGQYLTPDFYVGTKVGLFNKQAVLVLKHKLTDSLNVETQAGTSQRIKLNYEFETD